MYRKEVNERSPLRILESSIHGGLGPGNIGVVVSRAGVGESPFFVQAALDELIKNHTVLHITGHHSSASAARVWYDTLSKELISSSSPSLSLNPDDIHRLLTIHSFSELELTPAKLNSIIEQAKVHTGRAPQLILIEDWNWDGPLDRRNDDLNGFRQAAQNLEAELWLGAHTHRSAVTDTPAVPEPCTDYTSAIDMVVFLEPYSGPHVSIRILKDHANTVVPSQVLNLDPDTMRSFEGDTSPIPSLDLPAEQYTLLSGAAKGAEAEFGECAEQWGLTEINFSFAGRSSVRTRGIVELNENELTRGAVSPAYVEAQLRRSFPKTEQFQKMLQTIWHQVATAGEVFVVGLILPDDTVNGGTGWAAELGRHFKKPVRVFDQERKEWFTWQENHWHPIGRPNIQRTRFAGTGTRFLSEEGRQAIHDLFKDTFGTPKRE